MANQYFKFKQFTIIQEKSAMKVGTDGVLLGAWTNCYDKQQILDIGTGTGLITLMLAQRTDDNARIDTVEIDEEAYLEGVLNVNNSIWKDKISLYHISFQEYMKKANKIYDLIVSNPPFFSNSKKANNSSRSLARHNDSLPIDTLFKGVKNLLSDNGIFSIIIPFDNHDKILSEGIKNNLFCIRKMWVKPTPNISPKRVMLEFAKKDNKCIKDTIILEANGRHQYSKDYINLTKEFYLSL